MTGVKVQISTKSLRHWRMGPTIHTNPSDFEVKSHVARVQKYRAVHKFEGALPQQLAS